MKTPYFSTLLLLTSVLTLACGSHDRTSSADIPRWSVDSQPVVLIGGNSPLPGHELFDVVGATRLSDGRIVIANSGSDELRFFSSDGTLLTVAGGGGRGPGELRSMWGVTRLDGDTLLVSSLSPGLTRYTGEGQFIDQGPIPFARFELPCMTFDRELLLRPHASLLLHFENLVGTPGCTPVPDRVFRTDGLVALYSLAGDRLDTLAILPGTEYDGMKRRAFERELLVAGGRNRIFVGESGGDSILVFATDGSPLGTAPVPFGPQPVPDSAKTVTEFTVRTRSGRTLRREVSYPDEYPRFGRLLVDTEDLLWVMAFPPLTVPGNSTSLSGPLSAWAPPGSGMWRVLDGAGHVRAEVSTPGGLFPYEIGSDYVLGVQHDSLRVESIALYRLRRSDL